MDNHPWQDAIDRAADTGYDKQLALYETVYEVLWSLKAWDEVTCCEVAAEIIDRLRADELL
jgi:hypothetical protein